MQETSNPEKSEAEVLVRRIIEEAKKLHNAFLDVLVADLAFEEAVSSREPANTIKEKMEALENAQRVFLNSSANIQSLLKE